jgi:hypothetical protein
MSGAHCRWSLSVPVRLLLLSLLTLSLAVGLSSCGGKGGKAGGANKGLVGRWESEERSQGSIGNTMEMTADNKVYYTVGAMVDGKYTFAGDQLTVAVGDSTRQSRVTGFRVEGDTLTIIPGGEAQPQALVRSGTRARGTPMAGTWTYHHPAGASAYEAYAPAGDFFFRMPMQTIEGTYTVTADSVEFRLAEAPARKAAFRIENGILTLTDPEGRAGRFTPADAVLSPECSRAAAAAPPPEMMAPPVGAPPAEGSPPADQPSGGQ